MAPERELSKRVGRKLTKRRKPERHTSVQYPDRLKEGDDVQEDVTAAKGQRAQYVNQSVFSLIAAAGSKVDFHARFDEDSSGSEDEPDPTAIIRTHAAPVPSHRSHHDRHQGVVVGDDESRLDDSTQERGPRRSLPKLNLRTVREKNYMSQSSLPQSFGQISPPENAKGFTPRDAPVMSKMLEAQAQLHSSTIGSGTTKDVTEGTTQEAHGQGPTTLATRLMEIFGFDAPEEVIAGEPKSPAVLLLASTDYLPRVPLLAPTKCSTPRLSLHYSMSSLFLCLFTQEICKLCMATNIVEVSLLRPRMLLQDLGILRKGADRIQSSNVTGLPLKETSFLTTLARPICISLVAI